ncbi:Nuclear valosin-containing protein-like [Smittium culicis]|uniref:Nuclear valosin-containing protein-like n=1 Tax=Smittium culicis TaxID=133412 RepID=A0A1R1YSI4_9FUNG|nr:Nuclear valosin-containing protein-like [Smittium culicis]OMJ29837.1 Nuclear valosin-containing protein-like [Smittium culicis]
MIENDFNIALLNMKPSSLFEYQTKTSVIDPIVNSEKYQKLEVYPPRGILLHGPSGVGKSYLSFAIANESGINTIFTDGTELRSMIVGESESAIRNLFNRARQSSPCIIVFDHIDSLAPSRSSHGTSEGGSNRIVTTLLTGNLHLIM